MTWAWVRLPTSFSWGALLLLIALFGAWELYVDLGGADPQLLPPPHAVFSDLYTDRSLLWSNFLVTAEEVLLGILVAALAGLALALALHFSKTLRQAVYPLAVGSQAIPIPIFALPLVTWLGFGIGPRLGVIALVSFFPIVVTTLAGLDAVDPDLIKLMRTFDAPRRRTFWHVELRSALPGILTGAKIAVTVAVIGAVFAELIGSNSGLGYLFEQAWNQFLMPRVDAIGLILSLFGVALFTLLSLLERLVVPWAYQARGEPSQ
jgi:NitT/TauT family transport system permease protein/putative hydroxymethylpyrimidine transport system permease protein